MSEYDDNQISEVLSSVSDLVSYNEWNQGTMIVISKLDRLIDKDNIELLINDFKQALEEFGHFNFIHIQSNRGESVDIIF